MELCVEDLESRLAQHKSDRLDLAKHGFTGFDNLKDDELVQAFVDAGLHEEHPELLEGRPR